MTPTPEYCKTKCNAGRFYDKKGCMAMGGKCRNPEGLKIAKEEMQKLQRMV